LAFNGRVHHLEQGYWIKFEIARVPPTPERPHGLRYAFTLHDPEGNRLLGFDNAHAVSRSKGGTPGHDHWHRNEKDEGRPYRFTDADTLLADFEAEIVRVLDERGVVYSVIAVDETTRGGRS
jgi:hypothetical protein